MKQSMRINQKGLSVLFLVFLLLPAGALALELTYPRLPGAPELTEGIQLPELVLYIFSFGIIISGLTALAMFIWAGFLWLTSAAKPAQKADAKDRIIKAILGLLLLLGSYIILTIINPELPRLESPTLVDPAILARALEELKIELAGLPKPAGAPQRTCQPEELFCVESFPTGSGKLAWEKYNWGGNPEALFDRLNTLVQEGNVLTSQIYNSLNSMVSAGRLAASLAGNCSANPCSSDCSWQDPPPYCLSGCCGNNSCETWAGEDCNTCSTDCGACAAPPPPPPPPPPEEEPLPPPPPEEEPPPPPPPPEEEPPLEWWEWLFPWFSLEAQAQTCAPACIVDPDPYCAINDCAGEPCPDRSGINNVLTSITSSRDLIRANYDRIKNGIIPEIEELQTEIEKLKNDASRCFANPMRRILWCGYLQVIVKAAVEGGTVNELLKDPLKVDEALNCNEGTYFCLWEE